ncbi:MAG: hypothetical protein HQL60_07350, partial [Magnetococcales bacterium]|nr:hypothetical protein [Magnetococcales bacterium]
MNGTVTIDDVWAVLRENALQQKETDRQMQETKKLIQETAQQMRETDRRMQETNLEFKQLRKLVGNIGNRLGEFVEAMVKPACFRLFQGNDIQIHIIHHRLSSTIPGAAMEVDVLAESQQAVVAIEVKSKIDKEDIDRHIYRLQRFKKAFPRYADCTVYGAVATMVLDNNLKQLAIDHGLFVIVPSGDTVVLA